MTLEQLTTEFLALKGRIDALEKSGLYVFNKDLQILDGRDLIIGTQAGTMFGGAKSKLGFFGVAPVAQQSHISVPSGGSTVDSQARTAINSLITLMQALGLTS